eukprot:m.53227 g.53227  ORF g.53227 m.53227 type:complete len:356 (+) comp6455_c0_seq2:18-1085(+)
MEPVNIVERARRLGCHIATPAAAWIFGADTFRSLGIRPSQAPDLSVDPDSRVLTFINPTKKRKSFAVTVLHPCVDVRGRPLQDALSTDNTGVQNTCTTFMAVLAPGTILDVCKIQIKSLKKLQYHSDVHVVADHPDPGHLGPDTPAVLFPLEGAHLCTQSFNGPLTHYQLGTFHAIDFACPVGTPVLAVGAGVVRSVQDSNTCSGIHVANLFHWNSILIELDSGFFVEYVHIKPASARIAAGDRVAPGQIICEAGAAGFCPEPHLHVQLHRSADPAAPTVMFALLGREGPYVPQDGLVYSADGLVAPPSRPEQATAEPASTGAERTSAALLSIEPCVSDQVPEATGQKGPIEESY